MRSIKRKSKYEYKNTEQKLKSKPSFIESLLQLVLKMFENDFKDGSYYRDRFRSPNERHQND